ncbi:hypothetical protein MHK_000599 [Candidatus Magnetomorum sp. HK-1]|nr:hypothetical protein MHK_000599 [Candidatus Magnetomorum sp. HK-1]
MFSILVQPGWSFITDDYLLELISKKVVLSKGKKEIYISHLSFMDPTTGSSLFQTEYGRIINETAINFLKLLQKNPLFKYNAKGHTLRDTDANVNKLNNITFDPNITKDVKISKIIDEIMIPANIDVIVTGQYIEKDGNIDIRPIIILKNSKRIITQYAQYKKSEFICKNQQIQGDKVLCKSAYNKISELIKSLIYQL